MARVLLATGLLVGLVTSAAVAAVPTFDTKRLYSETQFAEAIKPYTDAIARNSNDAAAHRWLGVAYLHAFKLYRFGFAPYARDYGKQAVASLERAAQLSPEPAVLVSLAEAYIAAGLPSGFGTLMGRMALLATPIPPK